MRTNPVRWAFGRLEGFLNRRGYRISWAPPTFITRPEAELSFDLEFIIAHLMLVRSSLYFIQIGANDGISNDPLYKFVTEFGWDGILLEPLPEIFEMLQATYREYPNLLLLNAALAEKDGSKPFYTARMEGIRFGKAHQFSSFQRASLAGQTDWVPDIAQRIEERQVSCVCFDTLLQHANGRVIDLLQIDAEGYDFNILNMIDFSKLCPAIICYEHVHMSKGQQEEAAALLVKQGYRFTRDNLDTVAYRSERRYGFR